LSLHRKIPFPAAAIEPEVRPQSPPAIPTFGAPQFGILGWRRSYSGLSPNASNCRLHSAGGSRSRSIPMPRG